MCLPTASTSGCSSSATSRRSRRWSPRPCPPRLPRCTGCTWTWRRCARSTGTPTGPPCCGRSTTPGTWTRPDRVNPGLLSLLDFLHPKGKSGRTMFTATRIPAAAPPGPIKSSVMTDRGRLTAPGSLLDEAVITPDGESPLGDLAEMAARYGLRPSSARPGLIAYLRLVWQRRHFIVAYATARNVSMYTEARLGQLWQVLTPLLNSAVYYLIFGILFEANRGISDYIAYLITGVFIFSFTERSIVVGSTVMRANITLIRALHFPRACLPLAYVMVEFQQLLLSMLVLFAIVLGDGEPLTWYWLFLLPALVLQAAFIPRVRYAIMSTQRADAPGAQPYNVARCALFTAKKIPALQAYCHPQFMTGELWLAGIGWAVVTLVVGAVFFWQAETRYGRG